MKITITINLDNDAFRDNAEATRILHRIAEKWIIGWYTSPLIDGTLKNTWPVSDVNGNTVGTLEVENDS